MQMKVLLVAAVLLLAALATEANNARRGYDSVRSLFSKHAAKKTRTRNPFRILACTQADKDEITRATTAELATCAKNTTVTPCECLDTELLMAINNCADEADFMIGDLKTQLCEHYKNCTGNLCKANTTRVTAPPSTDLPGDFTWAPHALVCHDLHQLVEDVTGACGDFSELLTTGLPLEDAKVEMTNRCNNTNCTKAINALVARAPECPIDELQTEGLSLEEMTFFATACMNDKNTGNLCGAYMIDADELVCEEYTYYGKSQCQSKELAGKCEWQTSVCEKHRNKEDWGFLCGSCGQNYLLTVRQWVGIWKNITDSDPSFDEETKYWMDYILDSSLDAVEMDKGLMCISDNDQLCLTNLDYVKFKNTLSQDAFSGDVVGGSGSEGFEDSGSGEYEFSYSGSEYTSGSGSLPEDNSLFAGVEGSESASAHSGSEHSGSASAHSGSASAHSGSGSHPASGSGSATSAPTGSGSGETQAPTGSGSGVTQAPALGSGSGVTAAPQSRKARVQSRRFKKLQQLPTNSSDDPFAVEAGDDPFETFVKKTCADTVVGRCFRRASAYISDFQEAKACRRAQKCPTLSNVAADEYSLSPQDECFAEVEGVTMAISYTRDIQSQQCRINPQGELCMVKLLNFKNDTETEACLDGLAGGSTGSAAPSETCTEDCHNRIQHFLNDMGCCTVFLHKIMTNDFKQIAPLNCKGETVNVPKVTPAPTNSSVFTMAPTETPKNAALESEGLNVLKPCIANITAYTADSYECLLKTGTLQVAQTIDFSIDCSALNANQTKQMLASVKSDLAKVLGQSVDTFEDIKLDCPTASASGRTRTLATGSTVAFNVRANTDKATKTATAQLNNAAKKGLSLPSTTSVVASACPTCAQNLVTGAKSTGVVKVDPLTGGTVNKTNTTGNATTPTPPKTNTTSAPVATKTPLKTSGATAVFLSSFFAVLAAFVLFM
jgi:uncharacterized protein YlaN (UPF0358 family)